MSIRWTRPEVWTLLAVTLAVSCRPQSGCIAESVSTDSVYILVDALLRSGRPDSALVLVDPAIADAREAGDRTGELKGILHRTAAEAMSGQVREAERSAGEAAVLASHLGDAARERMAARWLGYALLGQGRNSEALTVYERLLTDAIAARDPREEAYAHFGLAYLALGRGETAVARTNYELAAPLFRSVGESALELDALVGLARTLGRDGRYDEMRRLYQQIVTEGEAAGLKRVVGFALNNLGTYEYQTGDPGLAVQYWERVLNTGLTGGDPTASLVPSLNLALARLELGAFDEATADLAALLARCREGGFRPEEARVLNQLALVDLARGDTKAAVATWRRLTAMPEANQEIRIEAVVEIARSLRDADPVRALAACDTAAVAAERGAFPQQRAEIDLERAAALSRLGRHAEAQPLARRAAASMRAGGFRLTEMRALVTLAASELALGREDSALTSLRRAQQRWVDLRDVPRDPQWREQRGSLGATIHLDLAALLLTEGAGNDADDRARAAFETLQAYKARTLIERRLGPNSFGVDPAVVEPPVGLAELQQGVLLPDEVLLDFYVGETRSLVFVVTDSSCRAFEVPSGHALRDHLRLFLDLVASSPRDPSAPFCHLPAARRLGREILAPAATELRAARRVTIAADGLLHRLPFELLPWDPTGSDPAPLGAGHEVARVPSATLLAQLRKPDGRDSAPGLLILQTSAAAAGRNLPGTAAEVRSLRRRYRSVEVVSPGCSDWSAAWAGIRIEPNILHVPTHTEVFDQRPWNSRIALGYADDGEPCWLNSADIAALPLAADLVVLSGCSSAGGRTLSGEGVLGLTGAFLAAGSRTVVAALWDVDDAMTAALMQRFYRRLADGETVAGALAGARNELAALSQTAAPCFWAGFVVIGDGNLRVALPRRLPRKPALAGGAAGLTLILGGLTWRGRQKRDRAVISGRGRSLS